MGVLLLYIYVLPRLVLLAHKKHRDRRSLRTAVTVELREGGKYC